MFCCAADSMTMMDPDVLDLCSITWASAAYVVANLEEPLPRQGAYPTGDPATGDTGSLVTPNVGLFCLVAIAALLRVPLY